MYLKYGGYRHQAEDVNVDIHRDRFFDNGIARGYTETWTIQGRLHAARRQELADAFNRLWVAYRRRDQDLGFCLDDGTPTACFLPTSICDRGTRVVRPPQPEMSLDDDDATEIFYTIVVEGDVLERSEPTALNAGMKNTTEVECTITGKVSFLDELEERIMKRLNEIQEEERKRDDWWKGEGDDDASEREEY